MKAKEEQEAQRAAEAQAQLEEAWDKAAEDRKGGNVFMIRDLDELPQTAEEDDVTAIQNMVEGSGDTGSAN